MAKDKVNRNINKRKQAHCQMYTTLFDKHILLDFEEDFP